MVYITGLTVKIILADLNNIFMQKYKWGYTFLFSSPTFSTNFVILISDYTSMILDKKDLSFVVFKKNFHYLNTHNKNDF